MNRIFALSMAIVLTTTLSSCININVTAPTNTETSEAKQTKTVDAEALVESLDRSVHDALNLNSYKSVTSASDEEVENFAKKIKEAYLNDDLVALSNMMFYPINYDEEMKDFSLRQTKKTVKDASEFMDAVKNLKISDACKEVFKIESCENLWADAASGGISLGSGFIFFRDVNFDSVSMKTIGRPDFKIISLSGLE